MKKYEIKMIKYNKVIWWLKLNKRKKKYQNLTILTKLKIFEEAANVALDDFSICQNVSYQIYTLL